MQDSELLEKIKSAVLDERKSITRVLHLLQEVEARKLYAKRGFSSLFQFAVDYLGYSESAAHRRISAMRAVKEIPSIENKILSGSLTLTNVAQVQGFIKQETKTSGPVSLEEKVKIFDQAQNKSTRECEKLLLTKNPQALPKERRRQITAEVTELKILLPEEVINQIQELKSLWSHKNPNMTDGELIVEMLKTCLKQSKKGLKPTDELKPLPAPEVKKTKTRYIAKAIRQTVWQRDQGRCQFRDPLTKHRCDSRHLLQIDHIRPWALGGDHDPDNLRLLCATHNQLAAEQTFGKYWAKQNAEFTKL